MVQVTAAVFLTHMWDPIWKRFDYGRLWSLQPACCQNQAGSYMLDPTTHIRFGSVLSKKAWIMLCSTDLDLIWMAWSGVGQTPMVQKHASVQESLGPVLVECDQPAACFPFSDSVAIFHRLPSSLCAKPAWIQFGSGSLYLVLAKWIRPGSQSHRA